MNVSPARIDVFPSLPSPGAVSLSLPHLPLVFPVFFLISHSYFTPTSFGKGFVLVQHMETGYDLSKHKVNLLYLSQFNCNNSTCLSFWFESSLLWTLNSYKHNKQTLCLDIDFICVYQCERVYLDSTDFSGIPFFSRAYTECIVHPQTRRCVAVRAQPHAVVSAARKSPGFVHIKPFIKVKLSSLCSSRLVV